MCIFLIGAWLCAKRQAFLGVSGRLSLYGRLQCRKGLRFRFLCRETLPAPVGSPPQKAEGDSLRTHLSVSHLEATTELLYKDMSPDPVPTSCLPANEWLWEQKTCRNQQAIFSELLLLPSLFYCFEIFLSSPHIGT